MSAMEKDPTGRASHEPGAKLDAGKVRAGLLLQFAHALWAVAEVLTHGAEKYSPGGWQHVPNGVERYSDAAWRHLLKSWWEQYDKDSGLLHKAHEAWNVLAELELMLRDGIPLRKPQEISAPDAPTLDEVDRIFCEVFSRSDGHTVQAVRPLCSESDGKDD